MLVFFIFGIAAISYVYHFILKEKILDWWFRLGYKWIGSNQFTEGKKNWRWYVYQPLFECEACTAGQLAFWSYFFIYYPSYHILIHFSFVALSIVVTKLIQKTLSKNVCRN